MLRHVWSAGASPPRAHPNLSRAGFWPERWEGLLSPLVIGCCPWFFLHRWCYSRSGAFLLDHARQRSAGTFWCGHAPLVLLVRVPCLSFHPHWAGLGALLSHSFPWEGLCPPWALPESSAPAGDLKRRLRVQPSILGEWSKLVGEFWVGDVAMVSL